MEFELLKELNESVDVELEERIGMDMLKDLVPKKLLHIIKRIAHKEAYKKIIRLQHQIMKNEKISANLALVRAAQTYGISAREMIAVMDKERRYA